MKIKIKTQGTGCAAQPAIREFESNYIPRVGETIIFEEYDGMDNECVVKAVVYYVDAQDEVDCVDLVVNFAQKS